MYWQQYSYRSYESTETIIRRNEKLSKLTTPPEKNITIFNDSFSIFNDTSYNEDQNITIVLTWDKDDTDVDLHIFDHDVNHAWYGNLSGIPGAQLDHDDIDGFGPETFSSF